MTSLSFRPERLDYSKRVNEPKGLDSNQAALMAVDAITKESGVKPPHSKAPALG